MAWRRLTDRQWALVREHVPAHKPAPKGGRPWADDRKCFEGILWILWTGAPWSELPREYGSPTTCWRRLSQWTRSGVLLDLWRAFLSQLNDRQQLRWNECFIDGTFIPAKKGGSASGKRSGARERSLWYWQMARVLRSEFTWTRRPQRKSSSSKRLSTRSRSRKRTTAAGRASTRSA